MSFCNNTVNVLSITYKAVARDVRGFEGTGSVTVTVEGDDDGGGGGGNNNVKDDGKYIEVKLTLDNSAGDVAMVYGGIAVKAGDSEERKVLMLKQSHTASLVAGNPPLKNLCIGNCACPWRTAWQCVCPPVEGSDCPCVGPQDVFKIGFVTIDSLYEDGSVVAGYWTIEPSLLSSVGAFGNTPFVGSYHNSVTARFSELKASEASITSTWSNRFENSKANTLPNSTTDNTGSGSARPRRNYILAGARSGTDVRIKAKVEFGPNVTPQEKTKYKFALAKIKNGKVDGIKGPPASVEPNGEISLRTSVIDTLGVTGELDDYAIVGASDGALTKSNAVIMGDFRIKPVSTGIYGFNRVWLSRYVIGGKWIYGYDTAAAFLGTFLNGTDKMSAIQGNMEDDTMSVHHSDHPTHHVGVEFDKENGLAGDIKKYVWNPDSNLAKKIVNSYTFVERVIKPNLRDNQKDIRNHSWPLGESQHTFSWEFGVEPPYFDEDNDPDLHYAFGGYKISGLLGIDVTVTAKKHVQGNQDQDKFTVTAVVLRGTMTDTYDWDYDNGYKDDRRASFVQTGYGTPYKGGWIFRSQVNFDSPVNSSLLPYDLD